MGMTAATSEYAMLDSMFAMDPVFPGLGGLEGLDQLDQQFMPNWTNTQNQNQNQNNNNLSMPPMQQPIQPTFAPTLPPQQMSTASTESNNLLHTPPVDLPNSPWSTWLNGQGQAQTLEDGMMAGGIGTSGTKRTMSSSEVYKKVTKP